MQGERLKIILFLVFILILFFNGTSIIPLDSSEQQANVYNQLQSVFNEIEIEKDIQEDNIIGDIWIDKNIIQPLEDLKIGFNLPSSVSSFKVKISNDKNQVYYSKEYSLPIQDNEIEIKIGNNLGNQSVYLETEKGIITSKLNFIVQTGTLIETGLSVLDGFYPQVKQWMEQDISYCQGAKGYRSPDTSPIWIRDHTHQSKGFRYWEEDMTSILDWFFRKQSISGSYDDFCPGGRMEVEADVEYLMVLAVYKAWQATGDNIWMFSHLDQMERGLNYSISDPIRWSSLYQLIKRAFTIDTWDFQWGDGSQRLNENTVFGFMSGDNSGIYEASRLLSKMFGIYGNNEKQKYWQKKAEQIKQSANEHLWNRKEGYYNGFFYLGLSRPSTGKNTNEILSLSNVYNMNRGDFASHSQAKSIIQEYQERAKTARWKGNSVFQEWFSIHPNYGNNKWGTTSADENGEYVNGGIMPLVGGELSRASFEHGFEEYGLQELLEYINLTKSHGNRAYLWYWPDGTPGISGPETLSTDGWGSSAFLNAFIEGLAGVVDLDKLYQTVSVSPRWPVAETKQVKAVIKYGASDGYFAYHWDLLSENKQIEIIYTGSGSRANFHILMPDASKAVFVKIDGQEIVFSNMKIENSNYVDFNSDINSVHRIVVDYE
ncbi:MAG: trehalase family glycosidase [bacterium]